MIMGDENRLRQVFINLLANAIKFTPTGGSVQIEAEGQDEQIIIRFIDTGLGISKEDLPNVTQKFYKGNQTMAGSGLGLSIVDEILKLHDAKLYIDSKLGEGTTVTVIIPATIE
jgi:Signal transduction histidine kinase